MSGWRSKRSERACDCAACGVLARRVRLRGRRERGSAEVGTDSGMGSDMELGDCWAALNSGRSSTTLIGCV